MATFLKDVRVAIVFMRITKEDIFQFQFTLIVL